MLSAPGSSSEDHFDCGGGVHRPRSRQSALQAVWDLPDVSVTFCARLRGWRQCGLSAGALSRADQRHRLVALEQIEQAAQRLAARSPFSFGLSFMMRSASVARLR